MSRQAFTDVDTAVTAAQTAAAAELVSLYTQRTVVTDMIDTLLTQLEAERADVDLHAENCKSLAFAQMVLQRFPLIVASTL